jgi:hypothetical protein
VSENDEARAYLELMLNQRAIMSRSPAMLSAAIATTAANPSGIQPLYITISDPPTQSEVQQMLDRMNELISALYRAP